MNERFKYYFASQIIEDQETGIRYFGNKQVADLLNELNEDNKKWKKEYFNTWFSEFYGGDEKEYNTEYERVFGKKS